MAKRITPQINFASCKRRHIQADFTGGAITSDGGVLLLRDMDRRLGLNEALSNRFSDTRKRTRIQYDYLSLLR